MKIKALVVSGLLVCLLGVGLFYISYASNISNPFVVIKGVLKLEINDTQIEKISENPLILVGKSYLDIINYMDNLGYIFKEQEGNGYFFNKDNETVILKSEKFSKRYITWRLGN